MNWLAGLRREPWFWPVLACAVLLGLVLEFSPVFRFSIVTANVAAASFLAMVGLGQMFPVASGEGGIDLSIPFVMNLSALIAVKLVDETAVSIVLVLLLCVLLGMVVGLVNGLVVVKLSIPPIIATLAVGYIVLTLVQLVSGIGQTRFIARGFTDFIRASLLGIPTPFFIVLLFGAAAFVLINRTVAGRSLQALGQSRQAAYLSGIKIGRTIVFAYIVSGSLAGVAGMLLAASVGSADLEIGNPYLLASVGAVVLGGNRIAGGMATVAGTMAGALLLTLLVAVVTVAGLPLEFQNITRGVVITLVLVLANSPDHQRGRKWFAFFRRATPDREAA